MVKIRLSRTGNRNNPNSWIVVSNSRSPRDGKFLEKIGHYHQIEKDESKRIFVDIDAANAWISKGAQVSYAVQKLINKFLKLNNKKEQFDCLKSNSNVGVSKADLKVINEKKKKEREEYLKNKKEAKKSESTETNSSTENKN